MIVLDSRMMMSPTPGAMPTGAETGLVPGVRPHGTKVGSTEARTGQTLGASPKGEMMGLAPGVGPERMMSLPTSVNGLIACRQGQHGCPAGAG
jgi:hypothetical protein